MALFFVTLGLRFGVKTVNENPGGQIANETIVPSTQLNSELVNKTAPSIKSNSLQRTPDGRIALVFEGDSPSRRNVRKAEKSLHKSMSSKSLRANDITKGFLGSAYNESQENPSYATVKRKNRQKRVKKSEYPDDENAPPKPRRTLVQVDGHQEVEDHIDFAIQNMSASDSEFKMQEEAIRKLENRNKGKKIYVLFVLLLS